MKGVVVILGVLALGCSSVSTEAASRATLRVTDSSPLTVRGTSFKARERVRVSFTLETRTVVRRVRATAGGRFTASAGEDVRVDRCGDFFLVVAVGNRGSRASLKAPLPDCPPSP
jgi:hypothetical protein